MKRNKIQKAKTMKVLNENNLTKILVENKVIIDPLKYGVSGSETRKDFEIFSEKMGLKYMQVNAAIDITMDWFEIYMYEKANDFSVNICLYEKGYKKKPEKEEIKKISNNIVQNYGVYHYLEFREKVGNQGYPFCCGIFHNIDGESWIRRRKENFVWQQVFALDFDDEISFDEFIQRAERYKIEPNFIYKTFSCKDEEINKFRAVWIADFVCTHTSIAESICKLLMAIFLEADPSCKDASRIFFGGKGIVYENQWGYLSRLDLLKLIDAVHQYVGDSNLKHRLDKMREISEKTKICLNNGLLDIKLITIPNNQYLKVYKKRIGLENSKVYEGYALDYFASTYKELFDENILEDDSIYILVRKIDKSFNKWYVIRTNWSGIKMEKCTGKKTKIPKGKYIAKTNYENVFTRKRERGIVKKDIVEKCKLCEELFNDEYLTFGQLFGICTNLINIENGLTLFKECLKDSKYNITRNTDWQIHSDVVNKQELYATKCVNFCPYESQCKHGKNIIQTVKTKRNTIVVIDKSKLISLDEGQEKLNDIVKEIFENE